MTKLKDYIAANRQDAILWKTEHIWKNVRSSASQTDATTAIVKLLALLPTELKRDTYTKSVVNLIARIAKRHDDAIKEQEEELKALSKADDKSAEQAKRMTIARMRQNAPGKINAAELKLYLKDYLSDQSAKEKAREAAKRKMVKGEGALTASSLGLPDDFEGDVHDVIAFGIYEHNNRIYTKLPKDNSWADISNFSMRNLYHIATDGDTAYRIVRVKNVFGVERDIQINTDDLISTSSFKKVMARQGNFVFKGSDGDLNRLNEYLQKDETPIKYVDILGHDVDNDFYAFGNGILDTGDTKSFLPADETGVVRTSRGNFYLPAFSNMFTHKRELFQTEKNFIYSEKSQTNFRKWSDLHAAVHAEKGILAQLWLINALFRDITIANNQVGGTPILCLAGQPGSGKDTFTKGLLRIFGNPPNSINLGGQTTIKGFMRKFSQIRNGVVWVNEYKNNLDKHVIGSLKGIYDGDGYVRAVKSNDFQTDNTPINSACILSGQDMPTIENALLMRTILFTFDKREKYSDMEVKLFDQLQEMERKGLSAVIKEILEHREFVHKSFASVYAKVLEQTYALINNRLVDDRYIHNYALLISMYEMLRDKLVFPYNRTILDLAVKQAIETQFNLSQHSNEIAKWWQVVEHLINTGLVRPGMHYRFADNGRLFVRVQDIYPFYVKEMKAQNDPTTLSQGSLALYFKNDTTTFLEYSKQRINTRDSGIEGKRDSQWCFVFNTDALCEKYDITLQDHRVPQQPPLPPFPTGPQAPAPF